MKTFNTIISGTGGQGLITLLMVIAESAHLQGLDVKTSELHGLSQRGGSVQAHLRMGEKIYSPLIVKADLIISLELLESLRVLSYTDSKTKFLINCYSFPFTGTLSEEDIKKKIDKYIKGPKYLIPASDLCRRELGQEVVSGIHLLGFAVFNGMIPLGPSMVEKAIKRVVPKKHLDINLKAFRLAKHDN